MPTESDERKRRIVEQILEIEVDMFLRVPTGEEPSCRAHMEAMKTHRRGQFAAWSAATCESYLQDLERARQDGKNLMTLKYARMDKLVPPLSANPLIGQICDQYVRWQREIIDTFPNTMRGGRDIDDFTNYLTSELETYSDATLELLYNDVCEHADAGRNMSREVYEDLARQAGYDSLEKMEAQLHKE